MSLIAANKRWILTPLVLLILAFLLISTHRTPEPPPPAAPAEAAATTTAPVEDPIKWQQGQFGDKPFLAAMRDAGLSPQQTQNLVTALRPHYDFRRSLPSHSWRLGSLEGVPQKLELHLSAAQIFDVTDVTSEPVVQKRAVETVRVATVIHAELESSLYASLADQPDNASLAMALANVFAYELDFYQDPRVGDKFDVYAEQEFIIAETGLVFNGWGRILAARYQGAKETFRAYLAEDGPEPGYYDQNGMSLVREFLRSPLKLQRITSTFRKGRFHPVLKRYKDHNGVDYGVPTGTPVMAVANGRVTHAGRLGGAGIAVELAHKKEMQTQYFHLSRLADGLNRGDHVRQGDVIGYVGSTGLSTAPHLHFGMKIRGSFVNPLSQKFQPGDPIPKAQSAAFAALVKKYDAALDGESEDSKVEPLVHEPGLIPQYLPKYSRLNM